MKLILTLLLLIFTSLPAFSSWYNANWDYRIKLTVQHTEVDEDVTNFPVYIQASNLNGTGLFVNALSNGADLRMTGSDGSTEIPMELVSYNASGANGLEMYFLASSLANTSNSDFYLYYGNSGASKPSRASTYGSDAVWADYAAVYHMNEDPSGTAPQVKDSTDAAHDGTSAGSMTSGDLVTGKIGKALDFDGSNDYIDVPNATELQLTSNLTIGFWTQNTDTSGYPRYISKYTAGAASGGWSIFSDVTGTPDIVRFIGFDGGTATTSVDSTSQINNGSWRYVTSTKDGTTNAKMYIDGSLEATDSSVAAITSDTVKVTIASRWHTTSGAQEFLTGKIDEIRITEQLRSANWISTEYNSQSSPSTFYTIGAQETNSVALEPMIFFYDLF